MAFCKACGAELGGAAFCPKCGANQGAAATPAVTAASSGSGSEGIQENLAGLLCYLFGWLSGLIFLLIDKRPFVKFHAAQSLALSISFIVVWIGIWILTLVLGFLTALLHFPIGFLIGLLLPVAAIAYLVFFIYCMIKAYQHEKFKVPIIGNMVEKMVG
jgi:uncharacterized membrane protein